MFCIPKILDNRNVRFNYFQKYSGSIESDWSGSGPLRIEVSVPRTILLLECFQLYVNLFFAVAVSFSVIIYHDKKKLNETIVLTTTKIKFILLFENYFISSLIS